MFTKHNRTKKVYIRPDPANKEIKVRNPETGVWSPAVLYLDAADSSKIFVRAEDDYKAHFTEMPCPTPQSEG